MSTAVNETCHPITDVQEWLDRQPGLTETTLRALGELLVGITDESSKDESAIRFTNRILDVASYSDIVDEERSLTAVSCLTVGLALQEWLDQHAQLCEIGPFIGTEPPSWTATKVGEIVYRHPHKMRGGFPAGTLLSESAVVLEIDTRCGSLDTPQITAHVRREDQFVARDVLDRLLARADELNPFRGRAVRATMLRALELVVIDLPPLTRENVIVDESVWQEIDLGIASVRVQHEQLRAAGLGCRRGVLLCGPPGTGKSAVSAVVAQELLAAGFTVIYVAAKAGASTLSAVMAEAQKLAPALVILEDVDLWCSARGLGGGGGLSELLEGMDSVADSTRILVLASTNDASKLDAAATRTGRFDGIVEVGYVTRTNAARILDALLRGVPCGDSGVDTAAVASRLPEKTSGSDLKEIVRRATLAADGDALTTASLLAEVGSGRYRAELPGDGHYL